MVSGSGAWVRRFRGRVGGRLWVGATGRDARAAAASFRVLFSCLGSLSIKGHLAPLVNRRDGLGLKLPAAAAACASGSAPNSEN